MQPFFCSIFRLCALLFLIPLSWNCSCHCFLHCCCYTSRPTLFSTHPYINICACVYVSMWVCACVLLCLESIFMRCLSAFVTPNVSRSLQTLIKHRILTNPFGTLRDYNNQWSKATVPPTNLLFLFLAWGKMWKREWRFILCCQYVCDNC